MNIDYTVQIWEEDDQFIAHAMPLDIMSSGVHPEEARKALDEAVHLFLVTARDMNTLNEILQESHEKELCDRLSSEPAGAAGSRP